MTPTTPCFLALLFALFIVPTAVATPLDVAPETSRLQVPLVTSAAKFNASTNSSAHLEPGSRFEASANLGPDHAFLRSPDSRPGGADSKVPSAQEEAAVLGTALGVTAIVALMAFLKAGAWLGIGGPLFSRIASHDVLANDVRNRLHECIVANPGVTTKEMTRLIGIGWGTAVYHLARLEHEKLVVSQRNRQFRRYYKNGGGIVNEEKAIFAELKNATAGRLASAVVRQPGTAQKELCASVGITASSAHRYLVRLEEVQLLRTERGWKSVRYFPTDKLCSLIAPAAALTEAVAVAA